jgi:hypothetical protein
MNVTILEEPHDALKKVLYMNKGLRKGRWNTSKWLINHGDGLKTPGDKLSKTKMNLDKCEMTNLICCGANDPKGKSKEKGNATRK